MGKMYGKISQFIVAQNSQMAGMPLSIYHAMSPDSIDLECDRYHKWERYNDNWNNYTHLNPNANFLCKMQKDFFLDRLMEAPCYLEFHSI